MSSATTVTLPAPSAQTKGSHAAATLLLQVYVQPHLPELAVQEGPELSLTTASSSPKSGSFLSIFKSLLESTGQSSDALGSSKAGSDDKKAVEKWAEAATSNAELAIKELDEHLKNKMFVGEGRLTAADVAVFANLQGYMSQASHDTVLSHPNVTRHFDLIQNTQSVASSVAKLDASVLSHTPVTFDLDDVPLVERKFESSAKKDKKAKEAVAEGGAVAEKGKGKGKGAEAVAATPAGAAAQEGEVKEGKKEKKEKAKKEGGAATEGGKPGKKDKSGGGGGGGAPAVPDVITPGLIDMRVGLIVDVKKHPDADSLYIEQIDVGEAEPRTVVSGLVNYIPVEEMQGKYLVAVCNLKPASMRGVKSFAMVLAATSPDGKEGMGSVELVAPPEGSKPGDRVFFEGFEEVKALEQLPPKKKIFETIQPGFTTLESREAAWVDKSSGTDKVHKIVTEKGPCKAPNFVGASLS